jgi:malate dehydrogenase (oxaloacetate-decarboxylating)
VLVQFEDFAQPNAMPILQRYQDRMCCFNDDIQGTAAVTLGTLLAACTLRGQALSAMRVAIVGAGSAGCGIAEQIIRQMVLEGVPEAQARAQMFMVDRFGLLTVDATSLRDFQIPLAQPASVHERWRVEGQFPSLLEVVREAQPDILIGVSGQAGLFSEDVVRAMRDASARPITFPPSNPSRRIEAAPEQVMAWTGGDAIVATGRSDYPNQVNNVLGFPFLFRGALDVGARAINEEMKIAAVDAIAGLAREEVPETVLQAYGADALSFGPTYIIPKPFDL